MTPASLSALAKGDIENFIAATTPGGIEAQEKQGQIAQSFLETLPIEGTLKNMFGKPDKGVKVFEALGFVFGEPADKLFVNCTFPKGWRKKPTEHSMWTDLVDDKGRKRGAIFYKAAFYDRSAHVHLTPRFSVSAYDKEGFVIIKDECGVIKTECECPNNYAAHSAKEIKMSADLEKQFPDAFNPLKHWPA